jgi:hypothetical protein
VGELLFARAKSNQKHAKGKNTLSFVSACGENCARSLAPPFQIEPAAWIEMENRLFLQFQIDNFPFIPPSPPSQAQYRNPSV